MRRDKTKIGLVGYHWIGLFTTAILAGVVRMLCLSTTEDWTNLFVWLSIGGISLFLSYWIGRGIVYLISLLDK